MKTITLAGIALAVTSFQLHAATVVQTQASLTNLNYAVVDLRPYDLYAAKLTLSSNGDGSYLNAVDTNSRLGDTIAVPGNLFSTETSVAKTADGLTSATKAGRDQTASIRLEQSTFENANGSFFIPIQRPEPIGSSTYVGTYSDWTLSPYTRLTITGTLALNQSINGLGLASLAGLQVAADRSLNLTAASQALLTVSQMVGTSRTVLDSASVRATSGQVVTSAGVTDSELGSSALLSEAFTFTVENTTGQAIKLNFSGAVQTAVNARVTDLVVPEPGTWALMGLGLAGMALLQRRKSI